ncbi:hypothetical protein DCAR_0727456 [Daucus carota subsp. sativus]|uniref:Uncharacterized protein n=1 Tax=Daucus carota subsp. sativus TaxID=79200 RepID=A0A164SXQ4_DAUCS|nr:hypothetical protein DCAR_0727456 [Daucus carota subsp. sativus]
MRAIFVVVILLLAVTSLNGVDAGRVLRVDIQHSNHIETYKLSVYSQTRSCMKCWFQMLPSGPSRRGSGH